MEHKQKSIVNSSEIQLLSTLYFVIALTEVIAEFYASDFFIYVFKPMLIPVLVLIYWKSSNSINNFFITALFFAFLSNIFFISRDFSSLFLGAIFFGLYRIVIIYIVIKTVEVKSYLPIILGCIPFIAIFTYVTILTMDELGAGLYIYIVQVVFITFLGGFSLANYILNNNKTNYWLLMSTLLFTIIQFTFIIKLYYLSILIFQPLAMILYVFAQYFLCKFVIFSEERHLK
jgi:YhhN family